MTSLRNVFAIVRQSTNGPLLAADIPLSWTVFRSSFSTSSLLLGPKARAPPPPPAVAKATTKLEKQNLKVETDPETLAKYCCINYHDDKTEGGPGPELREDDFYPDWLWELQKEIVPYYELDPKTDEYWKRRQRAYQFHQAQLRRAKPFGVV